MYLRKFMDGKRSGNKVRTVVLDFIQVVRNLPKNDWNASYHRLKITVEFKIRRGIKGLLLVEK